MKRKPLARITSLAALVIALGGTAPGAALAVDAAKIPHYFGPYPNWALSPLPVITPGTCSGSQDYACTTDADCREGVCLGVIVTGGIKKFQDGLPGLCDPAVAGNCDAAKNNLGQYIPLAVPDTTTFTKAAGFADDADYYVIAVVQHRERMSSSLPAPGTLVREYVQLQTPANAQAPWNKHVPLMTALPDGSSIPTLMPDGTQAIAVDDPHYLGPVIRATKDRPVRVVFYNLLPKDAGGNLFLPVDSSMMGSGMGPMEMMSPMDMGSVLDLVRNPVCSDATKGTNPDCFKDNRATMHLHGGATPWISDGTPHQWITPASETTPWPEGVSVRSVPDMTGVPGVPDCSAANDGCMTFYYTNQQSARLMFYHDHSWGITRLNVYAGEAAGYLVSDPTEQKLVTDGVIPGAADTIPLVIQDRTFVPGPDQVAAQDPTWDYSRWGKEGDLWYHHVYMPAQNPGDAEGMSAYGRWMYGPWFWPPATPPHGPIPNPRYNMDPATDFTTPLEEPCRVDDEASWQYQVDPFCEPALIPGTPNISAGMEQFNDTPIVNGTAYPTTTLKPKAYRLRILNAANDRFFNLQWYHADPSGTEVALRRGDLAAAQEDPVVFPRPDTAVSPAGPSWIQIGTEGGFLPAPVVIPNRHITWITDPTRFDVGNVDQTSLVLGPAERADVVVDFSAYAGRTLILYNDAPAAYPARVASYDYYTGAPDLSPIGAPFVLPGYGPNTRTVMQVKIANQPAAAPFDLPALKSAFAHHADGSGVFESGQHPVIVGQAAYNSAYGTDFVSNNWCNAPGGNVEICDGFARISEQGGDLFGFNTLLAPHKKLLVPIEPKAIHDETNSTAFDEFGRMQGNLGVEAVPATPGAQNVILYPFLNPVTELIDATNLPKGDLNVTPIASRDGTQIWKITHNGVDTHPIHFHLYDVQLLNRVTWDNIIIPPDGNELGWKDTVRISPLEDTIVALRPMIPTLPFDLPNSIRIQNPMMQPGSTQGFYNKDVQGNATAPITNRLVNFGQEYMYHCHILSHEEMDMMRPVSVALPPKQPDGLTSSVTGTGNGRQLNLTWNDNSINETAFLVQKTTDGVTWTDVGTSASPLDQPNTTGTRSLTDPAQYPPFTTVRYQVVAQNSIGYGGAFPSLTVKSVSAPLTIQPPPLPNAPSNLAAQAGPAGTAAAPVTLTWSDNSTAPLAETGFTIQRARDSAFTTEVATFTAAANETVAASFTDSATAASTSYFYRVSAFNAEGSSAWSNAATTTTPGLVPLAPANLRLVSTATTFLVISWNNVANEQGFDVWRSPAPPAAENWTRVGRTAANTLTFRNTGLTRGTSYLYRVQAFNAAGASAFSNALRATTLP